MVIDYQSATDGIAEGHRNDEELLLCLFSDPNKKRHGSVRGFIVAIRLPWVVFLTTAFRRHTVMISYGSQDETSRRGKVRRPGDDREDEREVRNIDTTDSLKELS